MYKYTVYKPSNGDVLVKSGREEIYFIHTVEALYAAVDTYFVDTTWVSGMSWKNDTDATQTYTYTYTTGLTITEGSEVKNGFSLETVYKKMSVTIDHQEKVFKPAETTETRTVTANLSVPPRSLLIFYQRRYKFRSSMFFVLDTAFGRFWNICGPDSTSVLRKECEVEIMSEDYATLRAELDGTRTGTINVDTVDHAQSALLTIKREECSDRCKEKLDGMLV